MLLLIRAMAMPLLDKKRVVTHFSGIAHGTWCKDSLNLVTILGHDASNIDKPILSQHCGRHIGTTTTISIGPRIGLFQY